MKLEKILFPTDFSHCGDEALDLATALARESGGRLIVIHVEELPLSYGTGHMYYGPIEPTQDQLLEMLHKVVPRDPNIPVEYHMLIGEAASEIVSYADSNAVDLIVIGTHGRTGLGRVFMGSVTESVVRHAKCPVATFKHPKHKTDAADS